MFIILNTISDKSLFLFHTTLNKLKVIDFKSLLKLFFKKRKKNRASKKFALHLFYCFSEEIRLEYWWKRIYMNQSRSFISNSPEILKILNITLKHFCIFNNTPPASWNTHITPDFLTCYSCSYYSSMNL